VVSEGLSYVLPYRSHPGDGDEGELDRYLRWLSRRVQLIVVDGSDPDVVRAHRERWASIATTHAVPDADVRCLNGKVRGVLTGLRRALHEHVIIADDDVRYDDEALLLMQQLLRNADLVRPQNFFDPIPWHARWDTSRMLLNRALGNDHPGTLGVRRSFLTSIGGYDGDVLFENLELVRTVLAAGGRVVDAPGMYVRRLPPTTARFLEQRPRQAYDDLAQPARLAFFLALGPALWTVARRRPASLLAAAGASVLVAQVGRLRHGGNRVFDRVSPFFAPFWMVERACLVWLAVFRRFSRGGCTYAGGVIQRAATPPRVLRRRLRGRLAG
jgi:Glycosyltransferase like family 2